MKKKHYKELLKKKLDKLVEVQVELVLTKNKYFELYYKVHKLFRDEENKIKKESFKSV